MDNSQFFGCYLSKKTFETQRQSTSHTINEWKPVTITFAFCQGLVLKIKLLRFICFSLIKLIKLNNLI
jgi:hypothetical protein